MGETVALRLLLAFFTSARKAKGVKWCRRYVGGMHEVLGRWEGCVDTKENSAAQDKLRKFCRTCGACGFGNTTRPVVNVTPAPQVTL